MTEKQESRRPETGRLGGRVSQLEVRQSEIGREVRQLKDLLDVHNNSHATLLSWVGKNVLVVTMNGKTYIGKLLWIDKYNISVHGVRSSDTSGERKEYVVHKGSIESISLDKEEH